MENFIDKFFIIFGVVMLSASGLSLIALMFVAICDSFGLSVSIEFTAADSKWRKWLRQIVIDVIAGVVVACIVYMLGFNK